MLKQLNKKIKIILLERQMNRIHCMGYLKGWILKYLSNFVKINLLTLFITTTAGYLTNPLMSLKECKGFYLYNLIYIVPTILGWGMVIIILCRIMLRVLTSLTEEINLSLASSFSNLIHVLLSLSVAAWLNNDLIIFNLHFTDYSIATFFVNWTDVVAVHIGLYCILRVVYGAPDSFVDPNPSILSSSGIRAISKGESLSELKNHDFTK